MGERNINKNIDILELEEFLEKKVIISTNPSHDPTSPDVSPTLKIG